MITSRPFYSIRVVLVNVFILTTLCLGTLTTSTVPSNVAVVVGHRTTLQCAPGQTSFASQWFFVATGSSSYVPINSLPTCTKSSSFPQYEFNANDTANGQCDLIINNVTPSEAGWYQCSITVLGPPFIHNAQLTVLYASPNCSQNVTKDVAVHDDVLLKCVVNYSSEGMNATMTWNGCPYQSMSSDTYTFGNVTTTVSEIYLVAQQPYLDICTCNTTIENQPLFVPPSLPAGGALPSSTLSYISAWNSTDGILVQYCPDNVHLSEPTYSLLQPNITVTCEARGYPSPIYQLELTVLELGKNLTTLTLFNSSSITLSNEGIYNVTCNATNYITSAQQGHFHCTNKSMVYVYNVSSEAPPLLLTTGGETTEPPSTWTWWTISTDSTTRITPPTPAPSPTPSGEGPTQTSELNIPLIVGLVVGLGVPFIIAIIILIICINKPGLLIYDRIHANQDTRPKTSLKANPNGTGNTNAGYEMNQTTTQPQPDVTNPSRSSRGGYPPYKPEHQMGLRENNVVDPTGIVYAELQPQPQVNNRPGSRQQVQYSAGDNNVYSIPNKA